jgi:hypothetical protein
MSDSAGARLKSEVLELYDLTPSELIVLDEAAETADLLDRLNEELRSAPLVVAGSRGQDVVNPLVRARNDAALLLSRQLEGLRIPHIDEEEGVSPVLVARAKKAAQARWKGES